MGIHSSLFSQLFVWWRCPFESLFETLVTEKRWFRKRWTQSSSSFAVRVRFADGCFQVSSLSVFSSTFSFIAVMEEVRKQKRQRPPEIQRYKPPCARDPAEQTKKYQHIVGCLEETTGSQVRESNLGTAKPSEQKDAKCHDRRVTNHSMRGKFSSSDSNSLRKTAERAKSTKSVEASVSEPVGELITIELRQRISGVEDVSRIAEIISKGKTDCVIVSEEGRGAPTYIELLKAASPYFSCKSKIFPTTRFSSHDYYESRQSFPRKYCEICCFSAIV